MRVENINKAKMYRFVHTFAGNEYTKGNDDYFAITENVDDCKFELREDKAVLRYKLDDKLTTATLYRKCYPDYEDEICCRLSVQVGKEFVEFEASVDLMELCGMEVQ